VFMSIKENAWSKFRNDDDDVKHTHTPLKSGGISSDPRFQSPRQTWLLSPRAMPYLMYS